MDRSRMLPQVGSSRSEDAPLELSISRKPIRGARPVFEPKGPQFRDPRFDSRCGDYDPKIFTNSFSFVKDIKKKELSDLEKSLKKERNNERRSEIKSMINRMKNQMATERHNEMKEQKLKELKRLKEDRLKTSDNKRVYVRKSEIKQVQMVEKFKQLKETGQLTRYLERKRKKLINKDSKNYSL